MGHHYRITVQALNQEGVLDPNKESLMFVTANHDDILLIVERLRKGLPFDSDTVASFGVGLKLFTEVLLQHKDDPLFAELKPAIGEFMKKLKQTMKQHDSL